MHLVYLTNEEKKKITDDIVKTTNSISNLSNDINTKAGAIKEEASGSPIIVTGSDEAKPLGLAIDGKSEQNQYSGKNLFDINKDIIGTNNATYTKDDKTVTVEGVGNLNNDLGRVMLDVPVDSSKTYTVSFDTDSTLPILVGWYGCGKYIQSSGANHYSATLTEITSSAFTIGVMETSAKVKFSNIQIEEGSSDTEFEPYCGGIPSPNPNYKQEIRNIGVYDEASGKYKVEVKGTGKNLLKTTVTTQTIQGATFTVNEDKTVVVNGTPTANAFLYLVKGMYLKKGAYVLCSGTYVDNMTRMQVTNAKDSQVVYVMTTDSKNRKFTLEEDVEVDVIIRIASGYVANNLVFKPMVCLAEITDDTYEPYKETTATVYLDEPLRKGDKAYWNGGSKVRVDRYSKGLVLTKDNVEIGRVANNTVVCAFVDNDISDSLGWLDYSKYSHTIRSNRFKGINYADGDKGEVGITIANKKLRLYFGYDSSITSIEDVKALFEEWGELYVEYDLAEPIVEEIDIDLGELTMFYPTTILSNDCNANMEVTYIVDTKAYIDKKFAELATAML